MKNIKANVAIVLVSLIFLVVIISSCGSGDFSRSSAQAMIEESPDYRQVSSLPLVKGAEGFPITIDRASADETKDDAVRRFQKIERRFDPSIEAARSLGFVDVIKAFRNVDKPSIGYAGGWNFTVKTRASEKGKVLWKSYDLPETDESLPLAAKELVEITGLTKQGETLRTADFTYEWKPNQLGRSLDPQTEEFLQLPKDIQEEITRKGGLTMSSAALDWSGKRRGQAVFEKYDDGWRLIGIRF